MDDMFCSCQCCCWIQIKNHLKKDDPTTGGPRVSMSHVQPRSSKKCHGNSSPGGLLGRQTDTFAGPIDMNIKSKAPKGPESGSQLMSRMISAFYFEFNCGHKP